MNTTIKDIHHSLKKHQYQDHHIEFAFHTGRPFFSRGWLISALVKIFTMGKFSHVELVFPRHIAGENRCFSARAFGSKKNNRKKGVSFQNIKFSHPERWIWVPFPFVSPKHVYDICKKLANKKYDYCSVVLRYVFKKSVNNIKRWWCSEVCAYVIGLEPFDLSPIELYYQLIDFLPDKFLAQVRIISKLSKK